MNDLAPVLVVIRHPDYEDDIKSWGLPEAKEVYIDLGSQFNGTPDSEEQALEWATSTWGMVKDLPADHPARDYVRECIANTVAQMIDVEAITTGRDRLTLVEDAWYEETKGELDLTQDDTDTTEVAMVTAMWKSSRDYVDTVATSQYGPGGNELDAVTDEEIARRIAIALNVLWNGTP